MRYFIATFINFDSFDENKRTSNEFSSERLPYVFYIKSNNNGSVKVEIDQFLVKSPAQQIKERKVEKDNHNILTFILIPSAWPVCSLKKRKG